MKPKLTGPWYTHLDYFIHRADAYLEAWSEISTESPAFLQMKAFQDLSSLRLIYESNLIEGEGTGYGETREIVNSNFPRLPSNIAELSLLQRTDLSAIQNLVKKSDWDRILSDLGRLHKNLGEIVPSVSFQGKNKEFREVVQHYSGYLKSVGASLKFQIQRLQYHTYLAITKDPKNADLWKERFLEISKLAAVPANLERPVLFQEDLISDLHKIIADGLLPVGCPTKPGEFRRTNVSVGDYEVLFPAFELVPDAMKKFYATSNELVARFFKREMSLYEVAARITHSFVLIHPFPDFNGRISRLLLAAIMELGNVPFPLSLRGDKRGRHRYFQSLRRANHNDFRAYIALIAKGVVDAFEEFEHTLQVAGCDPLLRES